jgi:hypothetical protein
VKYGIIHQWVVIFKRVFWQWDGAYRSSTLYGVCVINDDAKIVLQDCI